MNPDTQSEFEKFDGIAQVGTVVHYWPKANVDRNATPCVGVVTKGWQKGVANITVIPDVEGAVDVRDDAFHISDKRLFDHRGNISPAGHNKGCWDFLPETKFLMKLMEEGSGSGGAEESADKKTTAKKK